MKAMLVAGSGLLLLAGAASAGAATVANPTQGSLAAQQANTAPTTNGLQQQVQANLAKAGFTEIKIMPESFMVRAKDQQGNPVMMVINPDSFAEVTTISPKNSDSPTANNAAQSGNSAAASGTTKQ